MTDLGPADLPADGTAEADTLDHVGHADLFPADLPFDLAMDGPGPDDIAAPMSIADFLAAAAEQGIVPGPPD